MNFTRYRMIFYITILASVIDLALPSPILILKNEANEQRKLQPAVVEPESRIKRQIVQPTWLNIGHQPTVDPTVYVNPQVLFETALIREAIQKAVDEDTFAVTHDQQDTNKATEELVSPPPPHEGRNMKNAESGLPNWYDRMQTMWHNWTQSLFRGFRN